MITHISINECTRTDFINPKTITYTQNGVKKSWDMVQVHDSMAVILYHRDNDTLLCVKQFRPPVYIKNGDGYTYELCAGIVDKDLSLEQIAKEEILEECGYSVSLENIERVTSFYTSVGFAGSHQTLFFAEVDESMRVNSGGGIDDEVIEVIAIPTSKAKLFVMDETKAKTTGIMFGFEWFLENRHKS